MKIFFLCILCVRNCVGSIDGRKNTRISLTQFLF